MIIAAIVAILQLLEPGISGNKYIQLTLVILTLLISNNCLSRNEHLVPAYEHENLITDKKNIVEKRRNCSGAISPLFHNIFNISLTSRVQIYIYFLNAVVRFIFSSSVQI